MSKLRKTEKNLYDKLCRILTEYEEPVKFEHRNWEEEFYDLLVEIQNDCDNFDPTEILNHITL